MPNGHGGSPFLGAPILFAALAGWRLAYHLHMRDADEYGGAYTSPDVYRQALLRYRIAALVYTALATAAAFGFLWWRGLP